MDDPIQCDLNIINLETYPKWLCYDALSYEWGSGASQRQIIVQGKPFMIGENLWYALNKLRSARFYCIPIWIDAICLHFDRC